MDARTDLILFPRDPITLSSMIGGGPINLLSKVFRFHYHSQKLTGLIGI